MESLHSEIPPLQESSENCPGLIPMAVFPIPDHSTPRDSWVSTPIQCLPLAQVSLWVWEWVTKALVGLSCWGSGWVGRKAANPPWGGSYSSNTLYTSDQRCHGQPTS